jgi:hypothetical protein
MNLGKGHLPNKHLPNKKLANAWVIFGPNPFAQQTFSLRKLANFYLPSRYLANVYLTKKQFGNRHLAEGLLTFRQKTF